MGILKFSKGDTWCHSTSDAPSMCLRFCYCFAGGVFALVALASCLSLCWHLCSCCAGVFVLLVLVSLSLLHPYCCQHCTSTSIFASVVLGLLPSSSCCLHLCCAGIIALVVLASLPVLCWHCFFFLLILWLLSCWCLHWCCAGGITFVTLISLLLLHWHCGPHCSGIFALVALASLPEFCTGVNWPHSTSNFKAFWLCPWGTLSLGLLPWGPPATSGLASLPSGLAPWFGLQWS